MSVPNSAASSNGGAAMPAGEASRWVRRWTHLVAPGGTVLDVACGGGRHARWFASRGHPVTALDRDVDALSGLRNAPLVTTLAADLENAAWPLVADARFAAVVVTNYLHRPLFPALLAALAPGGVLIYETFARGNETVGRPSRPEFLLAPGELLDAVRGRLRVVAFQDGFLAQPKPAYVQRICAVAEAGEAAKAAPDGEKRPETPDKPPPRYDLAG